jgi:hypothetical protein
MITRAWTQATSARPRVSPAITVAGDVGVASIRRDTPIRRVSIRATAPVSAVRNRNSRSSLEAARSNWTSVLGNSDVPAVAWVTVTVPAPDSRSTLSRIAFLLCGSTPTVGSSRTSSFGWCSRPMPMFSRRFIPPEYCLTWSPARSARPVRSSTSSLCLFAGVAFQQADGHRDRRGLACPVRPEQAVGLTGGDAESDAVHRDELAE